MLRLLASSVLSILGNTIGLIIASVLFDGFLIDGEGFIASVLFFTIAQVILAPFIIKLSIKYLPALRGGIALVTIFVVLVITSIFTNGLQINGLDTWLLSPLVIWLTTIIAGIILPLMMFKKVLSNNDQPNNSL